MTRTFNIDLMQFNNDREVEKMKDDIEDFKRQLREERAHSGDLQRELDELRFLYLITGEEILKAEEGECPLFKKAIDEAEKNGITDEDKDYPDCLVPYDSMDILDFEEQLYQTFQRKEFYPKKQRPFVRKLIERNFEWISDRIMDERKKNCKQFGQDRLTDV